jgi:hypothetical protein
MTTAAPAPTPDSSRPNAMTPMLGLSASKTGPMAKKMVVSCIVLHLPYLLATGPAESAPINPPSVYMDPTTPHSVGLISMHCARLGPETAAVIDFFLQRMTSSGALSSLYAGLVVGGSVSCCVE